MNNPSKQLNLRNFEFHSVKSLSRRRERGWGEGCCVEANLVNTHSPSSPALLPPAGEGRVHSAQSFGSRGFTLLEVLVALGILAVCMAAVARAASSGVGHVEAMRERTLADWVAQNRMALHAARGDWLPVATDSGEETQAGQKFIWREEVSTTPNPTMRRIVVSVYAADAPDDALRRMSGYLVEHPR